MCTLRQNLHCNSIIKENISVQKGVHFNILNHIDANAAEKSGNVC